MATTEKSTAITRARADSDEISRLVSEGKRVTDPDLRRRVTERGEAARRAMLQRRGVMDVAIDLLREARDNG